jgi:hypothetical protein
VTYDSAGRAASTGSTALVRYQRESEEKFARRNEVAWYENHLLSACRRFVGYIAKKPPLREIGHPLLEDFVADCDWRGNALDVFWQGFMVEARARGSMLLLVDMPRGEAATLADQREQRFFPYLVAIPPERIVAFALNDQGKIARVEIESVWDGKRAVKGWDAKRWWVRVDEREVDGDNHPLGVCPVLAFSESGDFPTFGDFAQIADISRRLFNARSELDEILRAQTFSILVAGYPADQAGARESLENAVIQIGTSNALVTPGQVAEFIAPPDGPASIYMDAIAKLEQAIDRASLNVEIPAEKQAESGIALTVRFQALNSALTSFARRMEDFERQVWEVASLWLGLPPERAAAIRSDTRKAEGEGLHYVQGPDGKMRVFQNGQFLRSEYLGTDPTKAFTVDENGQLVPNKQVQDYELSRAKAGASNVTAVGGDMALGKPAQGKVDEGLLDTSAALMRVERIGKEYRPEWSTYAKQGEMGFQAFREKLGGKLAPEKQKELAAYTSWRSSALDNMNRTIKDLTGSAMGVEEAARIMATLPNPDDSPSQFQRKLEDAKQQTRMALARLTYIKRNGLGMESVPLDRVPSLINDRGASVEQEIKKKFPSMTAKEVERMTKRQLAQEFGLIAD